MARGKRKSEKSPSDLKAFEIVRKADELLDAVIASSDILKKKPFTEKSLREAKLVGSFSNTVVNAIGKKLQVFKAEIFIRQLPKKLKQLKRLKKKGHFK